MGRRKACRAAFLPSSALQKLHTREATGPAAQRLGGWVVDCTWSRCIALHSALYADAAAARGGTRGGRQDEAAAAGASEAAAGGDHPAHTTTQPPCDAATGCSGARSAGRGDAAVWRWGHSSCDPGRGGGRPVAGGAADPDQRWPNS